MNDGSLLRLLRERCQHAHVAVPAGRLSSLHDYLVLLARWNRRLNLTALPLNPPTAESLDRLVVEPLSATGWLPDVKQKWVDVGSGGGSPAIPMKIVRPLADLTMVESREKKAAFLREAVRQLGLDGAGVRTERFEHLRMAEPTGAVDIVTVRAVRQDEVLFDSVRALLRPGGRLLVFGPEFSQPPSGFDESGRHELLPAGSPLSVLVRC